MNILICILLFLIGIIGIILNRSNIIIILMSIELLLLAIIYVFLFDNKGSLVNQIFIVMILTVAAAEAAIGLAIMVAYFRIGGTIAIKSLSLLYGGFSISTAEKGGSLLEVISILIVFSILIRLLIAFSQNYRGIPNLIYLFRSLPSWGMDKLKKLKSLFIIKRDEFWNPFYTIGQLPIKDKFDYISLILWPRIYIYLNYIIIFCLVLNLMDCHILFCGRICEAFASCFSSLQSAICTPAELPGGVPLESTLSIPDTINSSVQNYYASDRVIVKFEPQSVYYRAHAIQPQSEYFRGDSINTDVDFSDTINTIPYSLDGLASTPRPPLR